MDRVYWLRIREVSPEQQSSATRNAKVDLYAISTSGDETLVANGVSWEKVAGVLAPMLWARKASSSDTILWDEKELKDLSDNFRAVSAA
jgi:hypothetical protein